MRGEMNRQRDAAAGENAAAPKAAGERAAAPRAVGENAAAPKAAGESAAAPAASGVQAATILDRLAEHAKERVEAAKRQMPLAKIRARALALPKGDFAFEKALRRKKDASSMAFICECKKASPSKGLIAPDFPYVQIAREYEDAGADAISVLTEPKWFLGKDEYLQEIAAAVSIPCLRKDFTVDEYMIYEAKLLGAAAVLLICSILSEEQLRRYLGICRELGLSALTEAHDEDEIAAAIRAGAGIIGVNNRNLKDFSVDTENSRRLREMVPRHVIFVSESGIGGPEDVKRLKASGADAVLVGEALMRAADKKARLRELRGGADFWDTSAKNSAPGGLH